VFVPNGSPPVAAKYQRTVAPVLAVALKVTVPPPQIAFGGVVLVIVGSAIVVTVTLAQVVVPVQGETPTLRT
jgi:hypothetical protein